MRTKFLRFCEPSRYTPCTKFKITSKHYCVSCTSTLPWCLACLPTFDWLTGLYKIREKETKVPQKAWSQRTTRKRTSLTWAEYNVDHMAGLQIQIDALSIIGKLKKTGKRFLCYSSSKIYSWQFQNRQHPRQNRLVDFTPYFLPNTKSTIVQL